MCEIRQQRLGLIGAGLTLAVLALASTVYAQVTGTMSGYLKDRSGAVIPQVKVTATLVSRGTSFTAQTNSEGFYSFTALLPGTYTLVAEKSGFKRYVQTGLALTVRQNMRADVTLQVGAVTQSVTVTGRGTLVDTSSATVSGLVNDQRVVNLPLNGRNVISLAEILPGVLNVNAPTVQPYVISGPTMNVNGGRGNWNFFTFDGAYFLNGGRNTGVNYPPPDAVQEFRMQTANFDAQYGFTAGSQMAVVSKSGTNQFHGDAYDFLRNTVLDTRNFFASTVPSLIQNQFGGTAGGPIRKDKLFYFGSFQALIEHPQAVPAEAVVPTPAERNGDFSALLPGTVLSDPVNPLTGLPFTTSTGGPCVTNNIIASSCVDPTTRALLGRIPQSPTGTVVALAESPIHDYNYFGRLDWNLSPKNVVFGHAYVEHNAQTDPTGGGSFTTFMSTTTSEETDMVTVNDTYTISPTLVNQALASYMRSSSRQSPNVTLTPSDLGQVDMPQYDPVGGISVNVPGDFTTNSSFVLANATSNDYQLRDSVTWIRGRHTFMFGGEDLFPVSYVQHSLQQPTFAFSGSRSGNPLSDFMLGTYSSMIMMFNGLDQNSYTNAPDAFAQDEFKVSPRFTLTYGLRWEPDLLYSDAHNRADTFRYGAQSVVAPDSPPGILFPGDPGVPRTLAPADWANVAPRFGFAWDVSGNGKTSVRGGVGTFFDRLNGDVLAQENAPFVGLDSTFNGVMSNPFGSVGVTPPPVVTTGKFGCVKTAAFPGVSCSLFPLPLFGFFVSPKLKTPYTEAWNLTIQRQLTPNTMIEAGYVGNRGIELNNLINFNPGRFAPGTTYNAATGVETTVSSLENVENRVLYEPGIITPNSWVLGNAWRSWYDSLQTQLIHRMSHGMSVMASYTLSKALDTCSAYCEGCGNAANPFNIEGSMKGRAAWDRRNAFVASYLWSPPVNFSEHWKNALLGGWTISGITTIQSGAPITFYSPVDVGVNGTTALEHSFLTGQRIASDHPTVNEFFNVNAFLNPLCTFVPQPFNPQVIQQENCTPDGIKYSLLGQYGQSGRDILSGPGYSDTDLAILREFTFKERYKAEFRAEFFNVLNQVNFGEPSSTQGSSTFGQLLSANPGRIIQFALKFFW